MTSVAVPSRFKAVRMSNSCRLPWDRSWHRSHCHLRHAPGRLLICSCSKPLTDRTVPWPYHSSGDGHKGKHVEGNMHQTEVQERCNDNPAQTHHRNHPDWKQLLRIPLCLPVQLKVLNDALSTETQKTVVFLT